MNKSINKVNIPISEYDIELFQEVVDGKSTHIDWTFETENGESININFIKDNEENE